MKTALIWIVSIFGIHTTYAQTGPYSAFGHHGKVLDRSDVVGEGMKIVATDTQTVYALVSPRLRLFSIHDISGELIHQDTLSLTGYARWMSVDPARQYASGYVGMGNNPVSRVDPDGAWTKGAGFWKNVFRTDDYIAAEFAASHFSPTEINYMTYGQSAGEISVGMHHFETYMMQDVTVSAQGNYVTAAIYQGQENFANHPVTQGIVFIGGFFIGADAFLVGRALYGARFAAKGVTVGENVLSKSQILRIENAATRINKPITVVGSRANGTAGAYSDWDYIIEGLNSKSWSTIKNSLPGSRSVLDNMPRNIDILPGPVWPGYPSITILPR